MHTPTLALLIACSLALGATAACDNDRAEGTGVLTAPDKALFDGEGFSEGLGGDGGSSAGDGRGGAASTPSGLASYEELRQIEAAYIDRLRECGVLGEGDFRAHFDSLPLTTCLMDCYFELADCGEVSDQLCGTQRSESAAWDSCAADCNQRFDCGNGETLPANWQCDTYLDCKNGADEEGCGALWFGCGEGTPILASQVCDGVAQCPNARDEEDCPAPFTCDAERAIPEYKVCDGRTQCNDSSDEANCAPLNCL